MTNSFTVKRVREAAKLFNRKICRGKFFTDDACCPLTLIYCLDTGVHPNYLIGEDDIVRHHRDRGLDTISFWRGFDSSSFIRFLSKDDYLLGQQFRKELLC